MAARTAARPSWTLLDVALYWLTRTGASAARIYYESHASLDPELRVDVPAAITMYPDGLRPGRLLLGVRGAVEPEIAGVLGPRALGARSEKVPGIQKPSLGRGTRSLLRVVAQPDAVGIVEDDSPTERSGFMATMAGAGPARRIRAAWAGAHDPAAGVSRWARIAALAVPFTVLPSSAWRIAACTFHAPITRGAVDYGNAPSGLPGVPLALYVVLLSIASELLAFTAVGLVATWGEVLPRWIPVLGGRAVPALAATVPAALGAAVLTLLWTWTAASFSMGRGVDGGPLTGSAPLSLDDWQGLLAVVAYAPLLLWGPLLGGVTISYWKRRRRDRS